MYSAAADDHVVSSNASFAIAGRAYEHSQPGIECYAYRAAAPGTVPLDLYYSPERRDTWALASDASRAQAVELGYAFVETTAYVPASCTS